MTSSQDSRATKPVVAAGSRSAAPPPCLRKERRVLGDQGSVSIEFALSATMLFTLVLGCFEFACLMYSQITLQNAVREAGRYAMTGNHLPDPNNPGHNLSRVASITQVARSAAMGLDLSSIQISSLNGGSNNAGGPGDTVTISLTANLPLMTALIGQYFNDGAYTTTVSAAFRNEPFPPGNGT